MAGTNGLKIGNGVGVGLAVGPSSMRFRLLDGVELADAGIMILMGLSVAVVERVGLVVGVVVLSAVVVDEADRVGVPVRVGELVADRV